MTVPATPLVDPAVLADPHPFLARLRESSPVLEVDMRMNMPVWVVKRTSDCR